MLQFNTGPNMISMADAAAKNILIPDVASNFSEWIAGNSQIESFGLSPRQRQCILVQMVRDVVLKETHAFPAAAVAAMPNNAAQANATSHHPKSAVAAVLPVKKGRTASTVAAAKAVNRNAAPLDVMIPRPQSVVGARVYTVPKATIACPVVDAVQLVRSGVGIANVTIPRKQTAALGLALSGLAKRAKSVAQMDPARILQRRNAARTEHVKREQLVARMNAVDPMATVHPTDTVKVITDIEPDTGNAPEFTCVPITATNDVGAILELDDGCVLHYEPPEATTTQDNAARLRRDAPTAPVVSHAGGILARQASCTPSTTFTRTVWETETLTETGTRTVVVQGDDATFSCPEMEVTNDVGDTLALDGECILEFTPSEQTSVQEEVPTQGGPTVNGQSPDIPVGPSGTSSADDNSAGSVSEVRIFLMAGFVAVFVLWTAL
ncbi:unnamed protein product [Fusarium venenatum]|uniref:Uncharacterized protein n=1 Tax=Fusarium venenatum TaxID=56646 RepID=A0A2L2SS91_9HYPO|nr:uncharacterized protein FVRRES_04390 [Fusarium venenatum]CEI59954.1 unnamed protein product [Fusarium venenatum]